MLWFYDDQVITFGGSYTGNLAAWFKAIYPHLSDGSISSSGPLTAETNFSAYMDVVNDAMVYYAGRKSFVGNVIFYRSRMC